MNEEQQTRIEAAVFRRLRDHLQANTDVQNIDLMLLADFCRNCLGTWYAAAAEAEDVRSEMQSACEELESKLAETREAQEGERREAEEQRRELEALRQQTEAQRGNMEVLLSSARQLRSTVGCCPLFSSSARKRVL